MLGSQILEVAIGIVFVYVLLSLIASSINELVAYYSGLRSKTLADGLRSLFNDPDGKFLVQQIYNHPLIKGLSPQANKSDYANVAQSDKFRTTYIPKETFSIVLLDILTHDPNDATSEVKLMSEQERAEKIIKAVSALPPQIRNIFAPILQEAAAFEENVISAELAQAVLKEVDTAETRAIVAPVLDKFTTSVGESKLVADVQQFRGHVENWFDNGMEQVSTLYKNKLQIITLQVALALTLAINVDTIAIIDTLWQDDTLREAVVVQAETFAQNNPTLFEDAASTDGTTAEDTTGDEPTTDSTTAENTAPSLTIPELQDELARLNLPIGWDVNNERLVPTGLTGWFKKITGWMLTVAAISLGAPFWFSVLRKLINLRSGDDGGSNQLVIKVDGGQAES